jgi:single-strand DNA-binding protein
MSDQKRILIMGRLGSNPELAYTKKQEPVCNLNIAERIEGSEKPRWHRVIVWGKQAEQCKVHLQKGQLVFVQGQNRMREFQSSEHGLKKIVELHVDAIGMSIT